MKAALKVPPHIVKSKSQRVSIWCVPSRIYHHPDSPLHGVHQCIDLSHWDVLPLFQQCCSQLPESVGGVPTSSYAPVQFILQMLNWGQIWTVRWPVEWYNVVVFQKVLANSGYMRTGIIMLESHLMLLH